MLAADPPNIDGARETARRAIRDGNRASDVITRLRALFTKKGMASEAVDLNEAVREVIALSVSELQRGRVILRAELAEDLPPVSGDRVRLAVQDTGVGFELSGVERLFEAFYTTKSGGMGIGLLVSRSIIETHRGQLGAAPNEGPGPTFWFSIPHAGN